MTALRVVLAFEFLVLIYIVSACNGLGASRNRYKNASAQIDARFRRRYDPVPSLVETAKGCIKHKRGTLEAVIAAREEPSRGQHDRRLRTPAAPQPGRLKPVSRWSLRVRISNMFISSVRFPGIRSI